MKPSHTLREKFSNGPEGTLIQPQTFCVFKRQGSKNATCGFKNKNAWEMF